MRANIQPLDPKHANPKLPDGEKHRAPGIREDASTLERLLLKMVGGLELRGLKPDRVRTFCHRWRACLYLLFRAGDKDFSVNEWTAKRPYDLPSRIWSPEQKEVLDTVAKGISNGDANVCTKDRFLFVTGGPGTGKTEVVIHAAVNAVKEGCRVLIACPVGALIKTYKEKLPPHEEITVETIHSSFRITRKADEQYVPLGRLRHYDLIIFDEISQQDPMVWNRVRIALAELTPGPFVAFVGDFQQLQPASGKSTLQTTFET